MTGAEYQVLGIVLCALGAMLLAATQVLLRVWKRKLRQEISAESFDGGEAL